MVEVGNFVKVQDSSFVEYGVKKGDLIYLAGDTLLGVDEKDPYLLRRTFIAAYTKEGHVDSERKPFLIDGLRCKKVSNARQTRLEDMMKEDFDEAAN